MKTIEFPFDIIATVHTDGVSAKCTGDWVKTEAQKAGLEAALQMISMMLENGTPVEKVVTLVTPIILGVQGGSVKASFKWVDDEN